MTRSSSPAARPPRNADRQRGPRQRGVLLTGSGTTWEVVTSGRFRGAYFDAIGATDGMVILAGSRREDGVTVPFSLWSPDLDTFLRGRFPRPNEEHGATVNSAAFSADGTTAVAVGVTDDADRSPGSAASSAKG